MPPSATHVPLVGLTRDVEILIGRVEGGAWQQALECECRGDTNAAIAWHLHARDLGEQAERLPRGNRPPAGRPAPPFSTPAAWDGSAQV